MRKKKTEIRTPSYVISSLMQILREGEGEDRISSAIINSLRARLRLLLKKRMYGHKRFC